ncbi:hypothetical protein ACFL1X_04300 [Candidatus Hydrogenedentota bacterium]
MSNTAFHEIEKKCRNIIHAGQDIFDWSWDGRSDMLLTKVKMKDAQTVLEILEGDFTAFWDIKGIKNAPTVIKELAKALGGLNKGQLFYASEDASDVIMLGMWWPWNNGEMVSLRIGLVATVPDIDADKTDAKMREWFGL